MTDYRIITDEKLITVIREGGKHDLFAEIMNRYEKKLVRYAVYLIKNKDVAEDAVQNAFIKTYTNLNSFDINKKFSSWIYRIVHNEAINLIKKNHLEIPINENMKIISVSDLENKLTEKETTNAIHKCLKNLPSIYAEPLILFYLEEKSYVEISDILRLPMGTIATRINRAKIIMKKICENKKI